MGFKKSSLESLGMNNQRFWENKKVLITGHTGFKGTWLLISLLAMGADILGYSLEAEKKSLFKNVEKKIENKFTNHISDILDLDNLKNIINYFQPDLIIHLAAQSLVRKSYRQPMLTWQTNVLGSLNILEASKDLKKKCSIIMVTTDKVYKNNEWVYGYRENDELGGYDPYSASKAAAEIAIKSWRSSFNNELTCKNLNISSARSGNVIGGGDWSEDRIVPDIVKGLIEEKKILIRNPSANRPWQHVLEPLSGYLTLAEALYKRKNSPEYNEFNFGPNIFSNKTVLELVEEVFKYWPGEWEDISNNSDLHEASNLNLQNEKAFKLLGWRPKWDFKKSVYETISWYKKVNDGGDPYEICKKNIEEFFS